MNLGMKRWLLVFAMCILFALTGCSGQQEAVTTATQSVDVTEEVSVPKETVAETTEETIDETAPAEVTEPVIEQEPEPVAECIDAGVLITLDEADISWQISEADYDTPVWIYPSQKLAIESEEPFFAVYIKWDSHPGKFSLVWEGGSLDCDEEFLHDYIRLPEAVSSVSFVFEEDDSVGICLLDAYTYGVAPEGVQDWQPPCETADILVFPTHADDDVLFFGPVISYYAIEKNMAVQTAFMTDHYYEPVRNHERLDGLWEMGVRNYPIVGTARDYYTMDLEEAANYHGYDDILGWQVEQIRRFKPQVILGHDLDGEYGHGQHKLNSYYLLQAVEMAAEGQHYIQLALQYGLWNTPKLYLHLYDENKITFDVNVPLENDPEGRTPFMIAQDAYMCHVSQAGYFEVSQNPGSNMDCTSFGLYRTLVGYDTGSDLMENIIIGE